MKIIEEEMRKNYHDILEVLEQQSILINKLFLLEFRQWLLQRPIDQATSLTYEGTLSCDEAR